MKKNDFKNNPLNENRYISPFESMHAVNYAQLTRTVNGFPIFTIVGVVFPFGRFITNSLNLLIFLAPFIIVNLLLTVFLFLTKHDCKNIEKTTFKKPPEKDYLKKLTKKQIINMIAFNTAYVILFIVIMIINPQCLFG